MLPSQFNPANYFGIDGDICCICKLIDGKDDCVSQISYYKISEKLCSDLYRLNLGIKDIINNKQAYLEYINFYNFDVNYLKLFIRSECFKNSHDLKKLNFDGKIDIILIDENGNGSYTFYNCSTLDFSNIIPCSGCVDQKRNGKTLIDCSYMFYNCKKYMSTIQEGPSLSDCPKLNYCFANCEGIIPMAFEEMLGSHQTYGDIYPFEFKIKEMDFIFNKTSLDYTKLGISNATGEQKQFFCPNSVLPSLTSALTAFSEMKFNIKDVETLANMLPTVNLQESHHIGISLKDGINPYDIESMFIDKGWTLGVDHFKYPT